MQALQDVLYVANGQDAFYYVDNAAFESAIDVLKQDQLIVTEYTEDELHGTFTASKANETVLTTLAYDKGWKVYVDGVEVETTKALNALIAFEINGTAGQAHDIDIVYEPQTYTIGSIVSAVSLILLILIIALEDPMKRVPVLRAIVTVAPSERRNDDFSQNNTESAEKKAKIEPDPPTGTDSKGDTDTSV